MPYAKSINFGQVTWYCLLTIFICHGVYFILQGIVVIFISIVKCIIVVKVVW